MTAPQLTGPAYPWRYAAAAAVLAAGQVWWSAAPISQARAGARVALILAIITAVGSIGQLALGAAAPPADDGSVANRIAARLAAVVMMAAWPELMMIAVLALEALHKSRPWHTAVLGAAIVGFLLAVHLAESRADATVLRRQLPLIGIGLGLSALAVGAAALPSLPTGSVSSAVRVIAIAAGVLAAGVALPGWLSRGR